RPTHRGSAVLVERVRWQGCVLPSARSCGRAACCPTRGRGCATSRPRRAAPRRRSLEARLATLVAEPPAVLAVVRSASFHVIEDDDGIRRTDPYVTPVLDALAAGGHPVGSIGLALDLRLDADWQIIKPDLRLLPMSFVSK